MMGPLIPQGIIDPNWSNVIAILIGFGFGFILERSGFSNARKIVGVFYGYDFTVIRVFMTAVAVAMIGLFYFNFMGWINLGMIFINPMYFYPILTGSVIMGIGFVIGGYCPGTSVAGLAIGKLDALTYTLGMYLGILTFSEAFPLFSDFFEMGFRGNLMVNDVLGISKAAFALIFVGSMLAFFIIIYLLRDRFRKVEL